MEIARTMFIPTVRFGLAVILGFGLVGGLISTAQAAPVVINPACGDTIGPGGSFVLGGDVGPCGTDPALTVDSAKLDLGGFTVSCDGTFDGIVLDGAAAELLNGTVTGCNEGVVVAGTGGHTVRNLTADSNVQNGFLVQSSKNELRRNEASANGSNGFKITGDKNELARNTAVTNNNGFDIEGDDNRLDRNTADNNGGNGFRIASNIAFTGERNRLLHNMATNNGGNGFAVRGNNNRLRINVAEDNDRDGIDVTGLNNLIGNNTATGHLGAGNHDLEDDNADCDANIWRNNTFGTKSQACIQ